MFIKKYIPLAKPRLSALVVFSTLVTYLVAVSGDINWWNCLWLTLGGFLTTGSANGFNQAIEAPLDALMDRTKNRPVPSGQITRMQAWIASGIMLVAGVMLLNIVNFKTAALALASALFYALVYTPLKQKSPIAVFVGAIPGAIPPLLGWLAATNEFSLSAWSVFGVQFIWQFPHFWAVAWVLHQDYQKANFDMLPSRGGRNTISASQIIFYTLLLIPVGLLPYFLGISGLVYAWVSVICAIMFLVVGIRLYMYRTIAMARQLMFASFIYLPVVQLFMYFNKL